LIFRLSFAAALVYSTRGTSDVSRKSQRLRDRIKRGDQALIDQVTAYVRLLVDSGTFPSFFGDDVTLVPVPGHAPLGVGSFLLPKVTVETPTISREFLIRRV